MKKILISLSLIFNALFVGANELATSDSLKSIYESQTICLQTDMGSGFIYVKNGQAKPIGKFAEVIKGDLSSSTEAMSEIEIASSNMKKGQRIIFGGVAIAAASVAASVFVGPVVLVGAAVGIVIEFAGIKKTKKGQNHVFKAIWVYNRDVMVNR